MENTVDLREMTNTELVMRVKAEDINSDGIFYTDSVGLQMLRRKFYPDARIETNYFPMPSAFLFQDDQTRYRLLSLPGLLSPFHACSRLSILSGQPHGATLIAEGTAEIMLDRICIQDDFKGLGSDSLLRDNLPTRSSFRLLLEKRSKGLVPRSRPPTPLSFHGPTPQLGPSKHRKQPPQETNTSPAYDSSEGSAEVGPLLLFHSAAAQLALQQLLYPPILLHHLSPAPKQQPLEPRFSPLSGSLPCDTALLSVRPLPGSPASRLLLAHRSGTDCALAEPPLSCETASETAGEKPWRELLEAMGVQKIQETSLSGVKELGESRTDVSLQPMDIRAYKLRLRLK